MVDIDIDIYRQDKQISSLSSFKAFPVLQRNLYQTNLKAIAETAGNAMSTIIIVRSGCCCSKPEGLGSVSWPQVDGRAFRKDVYVYHSVTAETMEMIMLEERDEKGCEETQAALRLLSGTDGLSLVVLKADDELVVVGIGPRGPSRGNAIS